MPTPLDTFSYGSVTLSYCHTEELTEDPVYDPVGGVDLLYTKVRLTVQGILAYPYPAEPIPPGKPGEAPADTMRRLEHDLNLPRQRLRYRLGGRTVLAVDPPTKAALAFIPADAEVGAKIAIDVANGPFPRDLSYPVITEGSVAVRFTIECSIVTCPSGAAARRGYASNRYEQSEDFDELGYRTVRTSGVMVGRSDLPRNLDQFRGKIVPPVPKGYQRIASRWTLSPDGLRLGYELSDREYYLGPPYPAKKASGKVLFASTNAGATYIAQCNIRMEAGKDIRKQFLAARAVKVALSLIGRYGTSGTDKLPPLAQTSFGHDPFNNSVEIGLRITCDTRKVQIGQGFAGVNMDIFAPHDIGDGIPGSPKADQPAIAPPIRGFFALADLIAAEYQDPCVVLSILQSGGTPPGGTPYPSEGKNAALIASGPVASPFPKSKDEPPYDLYQVSIEYTSETGDNALIATAKRTPAGKTTPEIIHPKITLHVPTLHLMVSWAAERTGTAPEIPDPCPGSADYVLKKMVIRTEETQRVGGIGNYKHRISGVYWYKVLRPCNVPLVEAVPPFLVRELKGLPPAGSAPVRVQVSGLTASSGVAFRLPPAPPGAPPPPPITSGQAFIEWMNQIAQTLDQQVGTSNEGNPSSGGGPSPSPSPTSPGNQPEFKKNRDIVWWRLLTVKPTGLFCGDCEDTTELTSTGVGPPGTPLPS